MSEVMGNKPNRDERPQINFQVTKELKALFNGKVKGKSLNSKDVLTRYVEAYLADNPAALQIASGEAAPNKSNTLEQSPQESAAGTTSERDKIKPLKHSEWMTLLEGILSSGHAVAIEAAIRNLQAFDVLVHSNAEGRIGDYTVPSPSEVAGNLARAVELAQRITAARPRRDEADARRTG